MYPKVLTSFSAALPGPGRTRYLETSSARGLWNFMITSGPWTATRSYPVPCKIGGRPGTFLLGSSGLLTFLSYDSGVDVQWESI